MTKGETIISDGGDILQINYEDYDVEAFGGSDVECTYTLYNDDRQKLEEELRKEGLDGTLKEMILAHFGEDPDLYAFTTYCKAKNIEYHKFVWIS